GRPVTREEFTPTFGQGTEADARVFGLGISAEELNAFYVEHFPRFAASSTWVNPEAQSVLSELKRRGHLTGLVTNSVTAIARALLGPPKLLDLLDALACADEVVHSKPAPDLVLLACRKLGVSADRSVVVGDSRFDEGAATSAGAQFISYGFTAAAPSRRVDSLADLLRLF
ncbi:MAG: HAD family hydrolase, partial [Myxococcaceae bacterium]